MHIASGLSHTGSLNYLGPNVNQLPLHKQLFTNYYMVHVLTDAIRILYFFVLFGKYLFITIKLK